MIVKVRLFAKLREQLGSDGFAVEVDAVQPSVSALVEHLGGLNGEQWQRELEAPNVLCAVNREVVERDAPLAEGDEVAFFPPVTGG